MWDFENLVHGKRRRTENHFDGKKLRYMGKSCKNLGNIKWESLDLIGAAAAEREGFPLVSD